jgi:hypothetical protein
MVAGKEGMEKAFHDCRRAAGKEGERIWVMADVDGW